MLIIYCIIFIHIYFEVIVSVSMEVMIGSVIHGKKTEEVIWSSVNYANAMSLYCKRSLTALNQTRSQ